MTFGLSGDDVQDLYLGKMSFKRAKAKVKEAVQKVQAPVQKYYGYAGKAVGYAAPIVGMAIGGTAGAAAGSAIGTAAVGATTKGNRQAKWQAAQRFGKYGLAVTAATGLTSLVTGAGITQGFMTQGSPFMPKSGAPAMPGESGGEWDPVRGEYTTPSTAASGGGSSWFGKLLDLGGKRLPGGAAPAMPGESTTFEMPGGTTTFDTSAGGGGGGPGGSAPGGGSESKGGETQNLILLGGAALGLLYLLKQ